MTAARVPQAPVPAGSSGGWRQEGRITRYLIWNRVTLRLLSSPQALSERHMNKLLTKILLGFAAVASALVSVLLAPRTRA